MSEDTQSALPESQPEITSLTPDTVYPPPRKSNKKLWIIIGTAVSLLCIGAILCVLVIVFISKKVMTEKAPVETVLDAYMEFMAAKDIDGAYALFSPRAQRQIPISDFQNMIEGNNYVLFEGYQSLSAEQLNINAVVNSDPDVPQGTVANVSGFIIYTESIQGTFTGTLEKVNDEWKLDGMYITVPPNKFP